MSIDSDQHHGYNHDNKEYEQERMNNSRPIFNHTASTESINSTASYHHHQQEYPQLMPQQQQQQVQYKSESSPHRLMSSQPTTPKPSSATATATATSTSTSPPLENAIVTTETSSSLPLEQKYNNNNTMVTPGTPTHDTSYSPHTNTIRTTAHRKDSIVPNINETCPSFGPTEYNHNIVSMDRHSIIDVRLHTKVDRGFFLAEEDWTCYRRNYFQVSGSFSLEGVGILYEGQEFPCLAKDHHGQLEEIHCFMLGVSARLSDCEKSIQLIQHTPKRDKGPQTTPTPKPIRPGGNIGFSAVGSSQSIVTFERLQFKTATANNGKRRAAQQYYVIIAELLAKLRNGNTVTVATTKSSALVVRGRSPGHYAETDSGVTHTVAPRQHRASNSSAATQQQVVQQQGHIPPYGRPTAYAGASPNLFQPTEYMPYDYHGVAYTNYGHMPPPNQQQQQQQQITHSSYPSTAAASNHNSPVPIMSQQQQQYVPGVHDRSNSSTSTETPTYPNNNNSNSNSHHDYENSVKEEGHHHQQHHHQQPHSSSPYYWQRSNTNDEQQQQRHHQEEQEHWNRMRIASNNSNSSVDNSQHGSPYMNHPQQQQEQQSYYAQQHHQQQYGSNPYGHHSHPPQSLPPPPTSVGPDQQQQHYPAYNYDWQPRSKMSNTYSYESDRRHEYNERQQPQQQQQHQTPPPNREATIVK